MNEKNSKTIKITGSIAAIVLALIAILTYASTQVSSVDKRLTTDIGIVAEIERDHYSQVMDKLMEQGEDIGEIKGMLGRIERKIDRGP